MAEKVPGPIAPHGGVLVNRLLSAEKSAEASARAKSLSRVSLKRRERCDLESLAVGVFSPLAGFMTRAQFDAVVGSMHLPTGEPWTIPVTLSVSKDEAAALKLGADVALFDPEWNETLGVLHLADKYPHDREREAREVYRTADPKHPGVALVLAQGEVCLGGAVDVFALPSHDELIKYRLTPMQVRREFDNRGWRRVAAFQ
ncbi:MAG: sulfate adenylyltransferase, partial [Planctomycetota bacterium]|nr:sulfate adenylyltransferase [Planctomycetota bacterium]